METEQTPFVAFHHCFGRGKCLACGHFGMLRQYVLRHGIAVRGDDTGDNEKQRPQEDIHTFQQSGTDRVFPIREVLEQMLEAGVVVIHQFQVESGVTYANHAARC